MHFLSISELTRTQLDRIFSIADKIREGDDRKYLKNKTALLFFPESSIRTRVTFEKAVNDMGGQSILFPPESLDKREDLRDAAAYLSNWADLIIIRHRDEKLVQSFASTCRTPVINGMTSLNHPCEILSDFYGISRLRPNASSLRYSYVGAEGNIFQSWQNLSALAGFQLNHINREGAIEEVLRETDVLLTDSLPEELRTPAYYENFGITKERIELMPENGLFNPCPPFFRGEELSEESLKNHRFVGYDFKKNLSHVQKALMIYCLDHA